MRAAVIRQMGALPELVEMPEPEPEGGAGRALVEVRAASLNPVNLAVAAGRYHGGTPDFPYIPGTEGAGVVLQGDHLPKGTRVRFEASEREGGTLAERVSVLESSCYQLPEEVAFPAAAALGVAGLAAWLGLTSSTAQLAAGDRILILGATGIVGQVAIQAARLLGAEWIIAAGRDPKALARCQELGADAVVTLAGQTVSELETLFREAAGGPLQFCFDALWGQPAAAAVQALAPRGQLVNVGQSAGAEATLSSGAVRGKLLTISGHSNQGVEPAVKAKGFAELLAHHQAGRIQIPLESLPLSSVATAWERQASSPHAKMVVLPGN